jgi:hypothetical protein
MQKICPHCGKEKDETVFVLNRWGTRSKICKLCVGKAGAKARATRRNRAHIPREVSPPVWPQRICLDYLAQEYENRFNLSHEDAMIVARILKYGPLSALG